MLYKVIFEDNTEFIGGNLKDSKWNEMPNKLIKKIIYCACNKIIELNGYFQYNHLIVHNRNILDNKDVVSEIILLCATCSNLITRLTLKLNNKELIVETVEWGKEFKNQPTTGWKQGSIGYPNYIIK